jgi:PAS domain-containing protein
MDVSAPALAPALLALAAGAVAGLGWRWLGRAAHRPARTPVPPQAPFVSSGGLESPDSAHQLIDGPSLLRRIDVSPSPFWRFSADLNLKVVNTSYARLAGVDSPAETVRQQIELFTGQREHAADVRAARRFGITETLVASGRDRRSYDVVQVPLDGGEVLGFALDRSDREASRSTSRMRGQLAECALDAVPLGIALFDASRALLFHNRPFREFFNLDPGVLATRPDFDRLLDAMRAAGRLPESPDFPAWRHARRGWFTRTTHPVEEDWTLPSGEIVRVRAEATTDGCLLLVFEDLTERVLLAGTRQSLLAVHQATLDHLTEGVAVFGPDGQIKLFNRRFTEIVLIDPADLAATPTADALMAHVARLLREPARAQGLRDLIMSATGGRAGRSGRLSSVLGYVLDYRSVPLPDGNALFTLTDVTPRTPDPAA